MSRIQLSLKLGYTLFTLISYTHNSHTQTYTHTTNNIAFWSILYQLVTRKSYIYSFRFIWIDPHGWINQFKYCSIVWTEHSLLSQRPVWFLLLCSAPLLLLDGVSVWKGGLLWGTPRNGIARLWGVYGFLSLFFFLNTFFCLCSPRWPWTLAFYLS